MARHNEINVGHFNRYIQKLTGIKGGPPAPQLSGDFQPVIPIFIGNENRYLAAWNQYGARISEPAAVGNSGGIQLTNPLQSNIIAVVVRCLVSVSVISGVVVTFQNQPSGGVAGLSGTIPSSAAWDSRVGPTGTSSVCSLTGQNTPSVGDLANSIGVYNLGVANQTQELFFLDTQEFPLLPATAIRVRTAAVNVSVDVTFWWRERFLEESERT